MNKEKGHHFRVAVAFAAVYVLWGSTYLAIVFIGAVILVNSSKLNRMKTALDASLDKSDPAAVTVSAD